MNEKQEMRQVSVSEIMKEHKLVVPEIQREYVWGYNEYFILETFLNDIKECFDRTSKESNPLQELLKKANDAEKEMIQALIAKSEATNLESSLLNIGFLYSYKPNYYINDEGKDAYLIDGQQRFTTIFLVLFYLAIKESRLVDFKSLFRINENEGTIAFDYRVRALTHNFIIEMVKNTTSIEELVNIKKKSWFLSNFKKDTTISAIVGNDEFEGALQIIDNHFSEESIKYFDYFKDNIKFWHFKTEETSQGEELYITMNSRGQQLADNETVRAILFKTQLAKENPLKWSKLWEEWQDIFWKSRVKDYHTADTGFNEFLACIAGLESFLANSNKIYTKEEFDRFKHIHTSDILKFIDLEKIESYIELLKIIKNKKENFIKQYGNYSSWVNKCESLIWNLFNRESTNWFADVSDKNRTTEQNRMAFIWPILLYTKGSDLTKEDDFFRLLRLYYVRFNNFDRSVSTISDTILNIKEKGIFNAERLYTEEILKHSFLNKKAKSEEIKQYEEIIWEIEDHKYNLNGSDVGNTNISYLVDFEKIYSTQDLMAIKEKFYQIFPINDSQHLTLQQILLYYGEYWYRISPWYYYNYKFDNWRKIIRGLDYENKPTRDAFRKFINDFMLFTGSMEEFLVKKKSEILEQMNCTTLCQQLCWYNDKLGEKMWSQGNFIAISAEGNPNALPDFSSNDKVFNDSKIIYNTKGNLIGGNPKPLYQQLSNAQKQECKKSE